MRWRTSKSASIAKETRNTGLWSALKHHKKRREDTDLVFPYGNPAKPYDFRYYWEKACETAELDDFRFHDLRHTAASYMAMDHATPSELADVLGHKTLQMVKRYAHLSEAHTHSVVASMNKKFLSDEAAASQ